MPRSRVVRHESALGQWEMVQAAPPAALRPYVREYAGWVEHMASPLCRRELPTEIVPVIINFGSPIRIFDGEDQTRWTDYSSFTTGAYDTFVLVGSAGPSAGLQINFTILGARLFLGQPMGELTNRIVPLDQLFGRAVETLTDELQTAGTWEARFAIVDRLVFDRLAGADELPAEVRCSWHRLIESRGLVPIAELVRETGRSQRHLIDCVRQELGLAPKTLARVLRFGQAVQMIQSVGRLRLADVALECGYYDQAHFSRDVSEFAGVPPRELVQSLLPDLGGFQVDW